MLSICCIAILCVAAALLLGSIIVGLWGPGEDKKDNNASSLCLAAGSLVVGAILAGAVYWQKHSSSPVVGNGTIEVKQ